MSIGDPCQSRSYEHKISNSLTHLVKERVSLTAWTARRSSAVVNSLAGTALKLHPVERLGSWFIGPVSGDDLPLETNLFQCAD